MLPASEQGHGLCGLRISAGRAIGRGRERHGLAPDLV